jgi:hypothetical protein
VPESTRGLMIKYGVGVQKRQVFTVVEGGEDNFE